MGKDSPETQCMLETQPSSQCDPISSVLGPQQALLINYDSPSREPRTLLKRALQALSNQAPGT